MTARGELLGITPFRKALTPRGWLLLGASPSRTLTDLVHTLQEHELRAGLSHYTLAGALGDLLDGSVDSLGAGPFQVLEIGRLMQLGDKALVPILLYLFHRIEQRLHEERPSLLVIEEAWVTALNSVFGQAVEAWLRTLRKRNTAVVFVSQSVADVVGSTRRDIILESCPTKIFLPNAEAETEPARRLYQSLGLGTRQIRMIATAIPKRQYYYTSPLGRRLITLGLGPAALSFVGMAGREARVRIESMMAAHGATWPAHWLRARGLPAAADTWQRCADERPA